MKSKRFRLSFLLAAAAGLLSAAAVQAQFGQNKIVYGNFNWSIYRSTHFQIFFYSSERSSLEKVASFAESSYDELSRRLNYQIPHPIPLIYYATHTDFEQTNTILNFIPENTGAFALPSRDRMVLPIDVPDEELQQLIQHELTHVFQFEILFQGNFIRAVTAPVPQWVTEGMASYYGHDESNRDRMVLRDAVISDDVPGIDDPRLQGYFAYRYGHAVYDFMEAEWGRDAVRDFLFEYRTNLNGGAGKVVKRTFDVTPDDFDIRFRRWLRKRYLPVLVTAGEPIDFGERFRVDKRPSWEYSSAPLPSGDLIASISTYKDDVDVVLLSTKDRKLYKNLSKGYTTRYEYVIAQSVTVRPEEGRPVAVSPDGNRVAAFVRRENGRRLVLWNVLDGSIAKSIDIPAEQPLSPAFSPDGKRIAFSALKNDDSDLYEYDLESGKLVNVTSDDSYEKAPAYSPDGQWIYFSAVAGSFKKIYRLKRDDPSVREQVTYGDWNDEDACMSPDGKRLYFTSDRNGGIYNIYSIDLSSGETWQHTDVIGGAFLPSILPGKDGVEKLVFTAYYKRQYSLYAAESQKPYKKLAALNPTPAPAPAPSIARYVAPIEVALDTEKIQAKPSHKLYIDNASVTLGVNTDNTFVSDSTLIFSDNLGDRRAIVNFQSVSSFTNVQLSYVNLTKRLQYGATLYDQREYFIGIDTSRGTLVRDRRIYRQTGAAILGGYPLDRYHRIEANVGFFSRSQDTPYYVFNADQTQVVTFQSRTDNDPTVGITFTGDTTLYEEFGPLQGSRYSIGYQYAPDLKRGTEIVGHLQDGTPVVSPHGGTLTSDVVVDLRHYFPITRRSLFAVRLYGARSTGNVPTIYFFGGFDTLRAYDFRTQIGSEIAFGNFELRFPLIDEIALPFLRFTNIRGRVFMDVGAADFPSSHQAFRFWNASGHDIEIDGVTYKPYELVNGKADYGLGFSLDLLGVGLHWDFARQWDLRKTLSGYRTSFYIGTAF